MKMKSGFFALVFVFALFAQAMAADGIAWGKLRWGMQPHEVSSVIGQMVRTVDNPGRFTHQIDSPYRGYKLAFTFFGRKGLERVALIDANSAGLPERFGMIREALTLKYGKPESQESTGNIRIWEWLDDEKMVQLHYRGGQGALMNIVYIWRKSAMAEDY